MALAPLRSTVEFDLTDVVTLHQAQEHEVGHGAETEEDAPLDTGPFKGLLLPASTRIIEQAAARGAQATYMLQLEMGTVARPGMTATVVRDTTEESWTREIELTAVELPRSVFVACTAVDVPLNQ
jgi:hypothetical protein